MYGANIQTNTTVHVGITCGAGHSEMMHLEFPLRPPQRNSNNPKQEGKGRFDMYIVLVDQSLWTSGTGSGQGVNLQDRNGRDTIQPKTGRPHAVTTKKKEVS